MEKIKNRVYQLNLQKPRNLKNDILSGLTVALALIPEAIAFSFVAGVDPKVGLYAAFIMGLITAIFGGRPGMISGATGAVAVIFAPLMTQLVPELGMDAALGYLFAAVILMGVIQMIFGLLRLGKLIRLVPHPVMLGFVNGLAIVIFKAQFGQFYVGRGEEAKLLGTVPMIIMISLIAVTMAISFFLPKLTKAVPATLVAIVTVTLIGLGLSKAGLPVRTVLDFVKDIDPEKETIKAGFPLPGLPAIPFTWAAFKLILPYSILAASVGLIESLMTLTLVDELTESKGNGNRESIAQGFANILNGFFGGMGGCAMIGQSVINIRAGGRGRTSGITAALALLFFILVGAPVIELIPLGALVGVMFMVVIGTFEWSSFRIMRKIPKADAFVIVLVSVVTVIVDLAVAVAVGIVVSSLVSVWKKGKSINAEERVDNHGTKIYTLNGPLFFGSATGFKELFKYDEDPEHVVIDFCRSKVFDHSGLEALNAVTKKYADKNKKLHLLNLSKDCKKMVDKADNVVEVTVIDNLEWHLVEDSAT
jgi:SulP family sulfate permease